MVTKFVFVTVHHFVTIHAISFELCARIHVISGKVKHPILIFSRYPEHVSQ